MIRSNSTIKGTKTLFTIVAAVNNDLVLKDNLLASPIIKDRRSHVFFQRGYKSASLAYKELMLKAKSDVVIFVHQDVYIPGNWLGYLKMALDWLDDKPWAVLGIIGITKQGQVVGRTWSTGIGKEVGSTVPEPVIVESVDELIFVVNRKSGIMFDDNLQGFHLYGTDIVQIAKTAGYDSYLFDGPVIHNSLPVLKPDKYFCQGYSYLQKKWYDRLPLNTLTVPITQYGWPLLMWRLKSLLRIIKSRNSSARLDDPPAKAHQLGYE